LLNTYVTLSSDIKGNVNSQVWNETIFLTITPSSQLQMENVSSLSISTLQEICNGILKAQLGQLLLLAFSPQRFGS
jgi:DNA-binding Xre family transcriptional regulator